MSERVLIAVASGTGRTRRMAEALAAGEARWSWPTELISVRGRAAVSGRRTPAA